MRNYSCTLILLLLAALPLCGQTVANYTFSATTGTYSVIQATSGAVSPALSGGTTDDGWYNSIPIGFSFVYEGTAYTTLSASTNGWARLGGTLTASAFTNNLNTGTPRPIIAPLWDDLETAAGNFTYVTTGVAPNRVCILEWLNAEWNYNGTAAISFQVKLYESSKAIEFVYRQQAGALNTPSASIGLGGATSGQFISLTNATASPGTSTVTETVTINTKPATGQIYRFDHYSTMPRIISVSPVTGVISSLITISGTGFDASPLLNTVYCGAVKATVTSASTTQLIVAVPRGTDFQRISVTSATSALTAEADELYDVQFNCGGFTNTNSFATRVDFPAAVGARYVRLCDIDGDGLTDVAASTDNATGSIRVFRNTSTVGSFTAASLAPSVDFTTSSGQPGDFQFSDVDGDGKKDMLVGDYALNDSISVLRNTSTSGTINSSSFAPRVTFKVPGYPSLTTADLDNDGKPEMIVVCRTADQLLIRKNNATVGSITTASFGANVIFTASDEPDEVCAGDLDNDGKIDLAVANNAGGTMSIFRNTSTPGVINAGTLAPKVDYATGGQSTDISMCDIDGDGWQDVVVSHQGTTYFSVFRNTSTPGTITFAARMDFAASGTTSGFDIGDTDGDGKPDVVVALPSIDRASVCRNLSTPGVLSFQAAVTFIGGTNVFDIAVGDLDADSRPEVLAANLDFVAGTVSVLYNTTQSTTAIAPATVAGATTFCDNGTWKTYYNPLDNTKVLFAVKDNGNNLGTITVDEYRDAAPGNYLGIRYLQRHFRVTPASQPITPVQVRLYFTNAELTNLMAVDPTVTSVASLSVTKYNGPTEDATYNPLDATSLVWYPQASITTGTAFGGRYLEFTISSFSEFWIHGNTGVLPIELLSFDAEPVNHTVDLTWQTASETNNDYFTIERSLDGNTVESIDTINGAGNSTALIDYHTTDLMPYDGFSYYRLKQVDFNGHSTYSEWKNVFMETPATIKVFPNPSDGKINLTLTGDPDALWTTTIVDLAGQIVYETVAPRDESQQVNLNVPPGCYVLHLQSAGINISQQLVITD